MAKFKIDEKDYDTDDLDNRQKRIVDLYQRALRDEAEAIAAVELKRAARIEVAKKLKEEVIDKS
jgi:hypothetical protein